MIVITLITPKAAVDHKLLFNKPTSGAYIIKLFYGHR